MFLRSLRISNSKGEIRNIAFRNGINLIVDETPQKDSKATGNNVGKTTVLRLIDYCLGANGKWIFTDPESRRHEYAFVKDFLIKSRVLVTLNMTPNLRDPSGKDLVIERNFLARKDLLTRQSNTC